MYIHCQIRQRSESQRICGSDLSNKRVLETGQGWVSPRQGSGSELLRFRGTSGTRFGGSALEGRRPRVRRGQGELLSFG